MKSTCQKAHVPSSPYKVGNGFQQNGDLSFKVPEKTNDWIIIVTFSKGITKLMVYDGTNEKCIGNVCRFKSLDWNGAQEKDAKITLKYQISFETESTSDVIGISFNEHDICSSENTETGTKKPSTVGKCI